MIVQLRRRHSKYRDLSVGQRYVVVGIEADDLRILNDHGRPYLYPSRIFRVVDSSAPRDWTSELGEDGERYAYPPALNTVGFFEDYFDGKPKAVVTFWRTVNQRLARAV